MYYTCIHTEVYMYLTSNGVAFSRVSDSIAKDKAVLSIEEVLKDRKNTFIEYFTLSGSFIVNLREVKMLRLFHWALSIALEDSARLWSNGEEARATDRVEAVWIFDLYLKC